MRVKCSQEPHGSLMQIAAPQHLFLNGRHSITSLEMTANQVNSLLACQNARQHNQGPAIGLGKSSKKPVLTNRRRRFSFNARASLVSCPVAQIGLRACPAKSAMTKQCKVVPQRPTPRSVPLMTLGLVLCMHSSSAVESAYGKTKIWRSRFSASRASMGQMTKHASTARA